MTLPIIRCVGHKLKKSWKNACFSISLPLFLFSSFYLQMEVSLGGFESRFFFSLFRRGKKPRWCISSEREKEREVDLFLSFIFFLPSSLFLSFASMTRLDVIYIITGSKGNFSTQGKGKVCITGVESIRGGIINELSPWETLSFSLSLCLRIA